MGSFFQRLNGYIRYNLQRYLGVIKEETIVTKDFLKDRIDCEIGEYTYGRPRVYQWGNGHRLIIGKYCSIAYNVEIFLDGNHRMDWVTTYPFSEFKDKFNIKESIQGHPASNGDVIIGNDVWIGQNTTILSGVTIGDGAVIGANSLVTKSIGDYEIFAGNPAKFIRKRFNEEQIDALKKIKWWNWGHSKVEQNIAELCSHSIDNFISKHN